MSPRTFHFRLTSDPSGSEPASATLRLERQDEHGAWEDLTPSISTPGFRLYLTSMLVCLHYHLVAEARERGLPLQRVSGRFRATTAADWALDQLEGDFQIMLAPSAEAMDPIGADAAPSLSDAEWSDAICKRMLNCPVFRNLDPGVRRTIRLQICR